MDLQWWEWGLCSHSPLLTGPLRQPSDSGLPVATPLFKLPPWVPGKFTFSQTTTSAGAVVAPSVLWLTAFQLQASKALYVLYTTTEDAGCFPLFVFAFITQALLIGQKHSQEQLIYKHTSNHMYSPGLILWMFCPIEHAQCWATFPPHLLRCTTQCVRLLHSLCQSLFLSVHCYTPNILPMFCIFCYRAFL